MTTVLTHRFVIYLLSIVSTEDFYLHSGQSMKIYLPHLGNNVGKLKQTHFTGFSQGEVKS